MIKIIDFKGDQTDILPETATFVLDDVTDASVETNYCFSPA